MSHSLKSTTLIGKKIALEPLQECHFEELFPLAQNEAIWAYHASNGMGDQFRVWFDKALQKYAQQIDIPFVVRRLSDKKLVGSTRYYDLTLKHKQLSIGNTWYIPEVWGTPVNPECKYQLLKYAFENLGVIRVQFKTDARNLRSRAAIKKLGAIEEGVLRSHMILDSGYIRDSVVFSIIQSEWPSVKSHLEGRIHD